MDTKNSGFNTKLIHAGAFDDPMGSATVPIYQYQFIKLRPLNLKTHNMVPIAFRAKVTGLYTPA